MFTTFAPLALESWTRKLWKPYSRRGVYFGSLLFWIIVTVMVMLKVMLFGAGVAVILAAQLVTWVLDLLTLGHLKVWLSKAGTTTPGKPSAFHFPADFDAARQQSVDRWSK